MDEVVVAVGLALVSAMATDSWQQARAGVLAVWQRMRPPRQAEAVERELDSLRQQILAARRQHQTGIERDLAGVWQGRLQELLLDDPTVGGELRRILEQTLTPMLTPAEQAHIGQITMTAGPQGASIVNQFVGDQYNRSYTQILAPSSAPTKAFRRLRADIATFTGRSKQLQEITQAVNNLAEAAGGVVAIHAINGMPGVGKTALAVHVGHLLTDRFPDGQLFVDLHAHSIDHAPADPADILATLLSTTGMAPEQIPDGQDERAAAWRDRMADKHLLLVLDNAASDEQVKPLLPGSADCLVLVTSRRRLTGLCRDYGATSLPLGVLPEPDAVALFTRIFPRPLTAGDQRAAVELVRQCGYLPLAITIVAAGIDPDEHTTVTDLLTDLDSAQDRLAGIDAHLDEQELGVAAAFDLSYQHLPSDQQHTLRLLGVTPGTDIEPYAAAALTDLPLQEIRGHLHALRTHRLIDKPTHDRYRFHDLIAVYVRARTGIDERDQALGRLLDYYQHTAAAAAAGVTRYNARPPRARGPGPITPDLSSQALATRWLRTERANLLACLQHTRRYQQHTRLVDLAASLGVFLDLDGPRGAGIDVRTHALSICREIGDRTGEAWTLSELGSGRNMTGDFAQAIGLQEQALTIFRDIGDRGGEAFAHVELGSLRRMTGDLPQAADLLERALTLFRETGNRNGEARALNELGGLFLAAGDYPEATNVLELALTISRGTGNRGDEAWAIAALGVLRRTTGDYRQAADLLERALTISREIGDLNLEASALVGLGSLRRITGGYPQATDLLEQALTVRRKLGDRGGETWNLIELGALRGVTGDHSQATDLLEQALVICREIGDRYGESEILNHQGALLLSCGDPRRALECHRRALGLARGAGSPLEEARALAGAGRSAMAMRIADGSTDLKNALEIFRRIGAAEALKLTAEVDALPPPYL